MAKIINTRHLPTFEHESTDFVNGMYHDTPRMLNQIAAIAGIHERVRTPFSGHISLIGRDKGTRVATSLLDNASDYPLYSDAIEEDLVPDNFDLWLGATRQNSHELGGSVIVQKGVSIVNIFGEYVIENGIIVEAVTAPEEKHRLPDFYEAGLAVAESMATNSEIIFAVEASENPEQRQRRLSKWILGELKIDPEVHMSVYSHFPFREDPRYIRRTDMAEDVALGVIYSTTKI